MVISFDEGALPHYGFHGFKRELLFSYNSYGFTPL